MTHRLTRKQLVGGMTDEEVYQKIRTHLLDQRKLSTDDTGSCRYRNEDGTKCAVGCLISEEHYGVYLEGVGVDDITAPGFDRRLLRILIKLQYIHDCVPVSSWSGYLPSSFQQFKDLHDLG